MKKLFLYFILLATIMCCCRGKKTSCEVEALKIDTACLKNGFFKIVKDYMSEYPQYNSITIYSKLFVEGSEGLCSYSDSPFTYYIIGPSEECFFSRDKFGNRIVYPVRWFRIKEKYIFIQSGQDALLTNIEIVRFYKEQMDLLHNHNLEFIMTHMWLFKTTRDSKCYIVSRDLQDFLQHNSLGLMTPLRFSIY